MRVVVGTSASVTITSIDLGIVCHLGVRSSSGSTGSWFSS